jgi:hypothetical protein
MSDLISATFSSADEQEVMNLIAQIRAKFPFGIKLTTEQSKRLPKLDDGRIPFVEKGVAFGEQQPKIVPPYTDLSELKKDLEFVKATRRVGIELQSLFEMVTDTRIAAGSDAYQAALSIYNSAKSAVRQGVPGTQAVVDEMGKLFSGQGTTAKPTEPATK